MDKRILIIGSLNMDIVIEMKRMPLIGETVLGKNLTYVPGGKERIKHMQQVNLAEK